MNMAGRNQNLNTVYISERLREKLRPISACALTSVVAPMGYGKTTAVNWYLSERSKAAKICVVRISVYSDNLTILWKSTQDAFAHAGYGFLDGYPCPQDAAGGALLMDAFCHELEGDKPCYVFIDDFHLMTDSRVSDFICTVANRLPANVHLIIASRDRFIPAAEILRLGNSIYQVGIDELRLNHTELAVYAHKCGVDLTDDQVDALLNSSEGWFSAIYLNLCTLTGTGSLPDSDSDIYSMFIAAMIDPLSQEQREFLAVMGLADEFTVKMASYVTGDPEAAAMLKTLSERNAFVNRLPDGKTFRFHHMMKECAERVFLDLDEDKQVKYRNLYGSWYRERGEYIKALAAFRSGGNYDAMLDVVRDDAGILLSSLSPADVMPEIEKCPKDVMMKHPFAVLVLMRCMFNWRQIPKMMELKGLLLKTIELSPDMDPTQRGNLLGECDLITSFLMYNDISAMSRLHRSASARMTGIAISLQKSGGWTFGSPSVLMMFHREPGGLAGELAEMDECMPHYYKITDGHGQGAELIMRAEADLMAGRYQDALIGLESAYSRIEGSGQDNMTLCCDFLTQRLMLCTDLRPRCGMEKRYEELIHHHNIALINIWYAISAYHHALIGETEQIPAIFREHELDTVNILAPGKPMYEMIENQVFLAQGAYSRVIGRSEGLLGMCTGMHYSLVALHMRIQTAAAYEMMGKRKEALGLLSQAVKDAAPDELYLPFVENYCYVADALDTMDDEEDSAFVAHVRELGKEYEARKKSCGSGRPEALSELTEREYEIVTMMRERMSNREIAEKLFLTEGSVKQYVNQIYAKLGIDGERRNKRRQLIEFLETNP